jgi:hypothetical protein
MQTFKEFAENNGKFLKLEEIGDTTDIEVAKDPFTLKPRVSNFKDQEGNPKIVFDYIFKDLKTGKELTFTNGNPSFARLMAKTVVGDKIRLIKIEKNGRPTYTLRRLTGDGGLEHIEESNEIQTKEDEN